MVPPIVAQPVDSVDLERHQLELSILSVLRLFLWREGKPLPPRVLLATIIEDVQLRLVLQWDLHRASGKISLKCRLECGVSTITGTWWGVPGC